MAQTPTFGCQIAPSYSHDQWLSDSSDTSADEANESSGTVIYTPGYRNFTMDDCGRIVQEPETATPVRSATLQTRTRSSRKETEADPVGFFHHAMSGVRLHVLKLWLRTNVILAVAILGFLCLYWGALFKQAENVHELKIWVVDFDGQAPYINGSSPPFVGPFVAETVKEMLAQGGTPGYTFAPPEQFDNDPLKVRESVYKFDAWAAVISNANASALLVSAVQNLNSSYDPLGACQIIYNTARDQTTTEAYIVPSLNVLQKRVVSSFGRHWISLLLSRGVTISNDLLRNAPTAFSPGIEFSIFDLRPFGPPIATPAVSVGLIYLIIISFFSFTFLLPIHLKYLTPKGHPPLKFRHLILWRYFSTISTYLLLSLIYSFVSLAFLMPMSRPTAPHTESARNPNAYGRGTFAVYWMANWIGMCAFGLASENMAMLLGTPWTALWLIFWVISNVATGFYELELAPKFYRWGYVWPMHNVVQITRSMLFDLQPHVGRNFGFLFLWVGVGTVLFPFCCFYMRWKTARVKKNAASKERKWNEKMEMARSEPTLLARITTLR